MKKLILLAIATFIFTLPVYAEDTSSYEAVVFDGPEYSYKEIVDEIKEERVKENEAAGKASFYDLKSSASTEAFSYYDQLNDIEKEMYDCIDENIDTTIDGTSAISIDCTLTIDTQLSNSNFWTEVLAAYKEEMGYSIYTAAAKAVYAYLYLDHPQYFWIDMNKIGTALNSGKYNNSGSSATAEFNIRFIYVYPGYDNYYPDCYESQSDVESDYSAMMSKANEIIASVPANSSSWSKLNCYMNWFRDNCEYNYSSSSTGMEYLPTSALLYGQDSDGSYTENSPVCEGYSEALKILCDLSDINCLCAEAIYYGSNGVLTGHKFNLIELDGKYYFCDPTWFDNYGNTVASYRWMLTGSTNMTKYDTTQNHTIIYQLDFTAPSISTTDYWNDFGINGYAVLNVDGNYTIDRADNASLLRIISGIDSGTGKDVNNDGEVDLIDVILMETLMFD